VNVMREFIERNDESQSPTWQSAGCAAAGLMAKLAAARQQDSDSKPADRTPPLKQAA